MLGTALPEVMSLGPARRNRPQVRMGSLLGHLLQHPPAVTLVTGTDRSQ
jgi:hypothetical protein